MKRAASTVLSLLVVLGFIVASRSGRLHKTPYYDEYPAWESELASCKLSTPAWRAAEVEADVDCTAKTDIQLLNVDASVQASRMGSDESPRTLSHEVLHRETDKLARGEQRHFHFKLSNSTRPINARQQLVVTADVRPQWNGQGNLGDFLDRVNADRTRMRGRGKYQVLLSRYDR